MNTLTFTEAQLTALVASVFWPMIRIAAMFAVVPIISNKQLQTKVKAMLSLFIALLVAPMLEPPPLVEVFSGEAVMMVFQQLAIGITMGFMLTMSFGALALAGEIIGYQMKLGMAKMADPINGIQVPIVTTLYLTLAMLVLLALDIHLVMIELLIDSFEVFPVAVDGITRNTIWEILGWGTRMFELGLLMALPIVGSILLLDIAMGVIQRAAPQMHIFAIGFPVTLLAGVILIWLTLPAVLENYADMVEELLMFIRDVIFVRT